jgi:saccharopine dehydrogenase-like NADP-dependent oxidoreductase
MEKNSVLLAGGYGVVGRQIAHLIRSRHPELRIIVGGRTPQKAQALVHELGNAEAALVDVARPNPLGDLQPGAVLGLVNDPQDYLLTDAAGRGIPFVDITRWTERLRAAQARLEGMPLRAPVILSSAWMAGVAVLSALSASRQLSTVETVEIGILYSLKDKSGPNSVEYMDRLAVPFEIMRAGQPQMAQAMSAPRKVEFFNGQVFTAYLFDIPDQYTLPRTLNAKTVLGRLTFDDAVSIHLLSFLVRSGIWKILSHDRFTSLRRSILHNPGEGGEHQIVIEVMGLDGNRRRKKITVKVNDPQGQTHLTALGAVAQFERLIGADGAPAPAAGVHLPETALPQVESVFRLLEQNGVQVKFQETSL